MGIGRRLGRLVLDGLRNMNREAAHPGRPPSYKATDSAFWDEPAAKARRTQEAAAEMARRQGDVPVLERPADVAAAQGGKGNLRKAEEEELPWYLQGEEDLDGWDNTNAHDADD